MTKEDLLELASKLSKAQRECLELSADGWLLAYYIAPGAHHGDRGAAVGRPYWWMRKGLETPKPPHWRVADSLQEKGLIEAGSDGERITPLGIEVRNLLRSQSPQGDNK